MNHHKLILVDVESGAPISPAGTQPQYPMDLFLGDRVNLEVRCLDSRNNAVDISGYDFLLGVDNSFSPGHADLIRVTSSDVSSGSSSSSESSRSSRSSQSSHSIPGSSSSSSSSQSTGVPPTSTIWFTLDMNNFDVPLKAFLGSSSNKQATLCIWAVSKTGDPKDNHLLVQTAVAIKSSVGSPDGSASLSSPAGDVWQLGIVSGALSVTRGGISGQPWIAFQSPDGMSWRMAVGNDGGMTWTATQGTGVRYLVLWSGSSVWSVSIGDTGTVSVTSM